MQMLNVREALYLQDRCCYAIAKAARAIHENRSGLIEVADFLLEFDIAG